MTILPSIVVSQQCCEQTIEEFYDSLDELYSNCKSQEIDILMGDFNAKVGCEKHGKTVTGKFAWNNLFLYRKQTGWKTLKPEADANSDHNPVTTNIKIYLRALKHPKRKPRFVLDTLKNPDISADFSKAVFENLPKNQIQENS